MTFTFFFFNDTATTEIYTLSLHDALPICSGPTRGRQSARPARPRMQLRSATIDTPLNPMRADRKSTRLNSSHGYISYAVFCLKKKDIEICFFLNSSAKLIYAATLLEPDLC